MDELSRYLLPRTRHAPILLFCSVLLLSLAGWFAVLAFQLHGVASGTAVRVDQLRAAQVKRPVPKLSSTERDVQKRWLAFEVERDFSWKPLFSAIERSTSPDIELLEFDPDKASHQLSLSGEAKTQQALVTFLAVLAKQSCFKNVHLTHQQKKIRDRLETVTFELKATIVAGIQQ